MARLRALLVVGLALLGAPIAAALAQDLKTEPTTKTEPTKKEPDPGSTSLTPTPTAPKPTGGAKTQPTAGPSVSQSSSASSEPPPSPSSSEEPPQKPKPGARSFARKKVPLGVGDLLVSISIPDNWAEIPDAQLPEVENTERVTVSTRKGFGVHDPKGKPPVVEEVIVACGKASGEYWADAVRDAAFTEMTSAVEKEARKYTSLKEIEPEAVRAEGDRFLQSFATDADFVIDGKAAPTALGKGKPKSATTVKLQGLNFIAFAHEKGAEGEGKTPTIVACSIACAHLVVEADSAVCGAAIGSIEISGTFAPPPKRSWLAELVFKLKKDPTTLWLGVIGALFLVVVLALVVILALRKKKQVAAHEEDEDDDLANIANEIKTTMHASPPPAEGYFDPQTLARKKT